MADQWSQLPVHDHRLVLCRRAARRLVIAARLAILVASLAVLLLAAKVEAFPALERLLIGWQWLTCIAVSLMAPAHSNLTLLAAILLRRSIISPFRSPSSGASSTGPGAAWCCWRPISAPRPILLRALSLGLAVFMFNATLVIVLLRDNRRSRQGWAAMQAERRAQAVSAPAASCWKRPSWRPPIPLLITEMSTGQILRYNDAGVSISAARRSRSTAVHQ